MEIDPRFEGSYFELDPDEAADLGWLPCTWYLFIAPRDGKWWTSATTSEEAVNIISRGSRGEPVPAADIEWALASFTIHEGTLADWMT